MIKETVKTSYFEYFWKCRIFSTVYYFRPIFAAPG